MDSSRVVAGFWRRCGAGAFDTAILASIGLLIGFAFEIPLSHIGRSGETIGEIIELACGTYFYGNPGNGITPGGHLLGVQVLTRDGMPLPLHRAFLRSLVPFLTIIPFRFLNRLTSVNPEIHGIWAICTCASFCIYLPIIFLPLKQGFHDIAADCVVIPVGAFDATSIEKLKNPGANRQTTVIIALLLLFLGTATWDTYSHDVSDYPQVYAAAGKVPRLLSPDMDVVLVVPHTSIGSKETRYEYLNVTVHVPLDVYRNATKTAQTFKAMTDRLKSGNVDFGAFKKINLGITSGFDLGIAFWFTHLKIEQLPASAFGQRK